jgi:triosephosphate isomerase
VLPGRLTPILCVGEKLEQREAGETDAIVLRQLAQGWRYSTQARSLMS